MERLSHNCSHLLFTTGGRHRSLELFKVSYFIINAKLFIYGEKDKDKFRKLFLIEVKLYNVSIPVPRT